MERKDISVAGVRMWIWLGPAAYFIHDTEESLAIPAWLHTHLHELPMAIQPMAASVTQIEFVAAAFLLFAIYVFSAALAPRSIARARVPWPYLIASGAFVSNGCTHLGQALIFGGYTPGVVTALLLNLPYGWFAGRTLLRAGIATPSILYRSFIIGMLLQVALAAGAILVSRTV